MSSEKIIFLDIDGTLIDYTQQLPPSAREAIRLAQARGHKLLISTGRSKPAIYPWLLDLGFDGIIAGEGAYAEFGGRVIFESAIPEAQISRLYTYLNDRQIGFYEESNSGLYGNRYYLSETARSFGISLEVAEENLLRAFPGLTFDHQDYHLDVNKVSFVMTPAISKADLEKEFGNYFRIGIWNIFGKGRDFGDFTQKNLSKASAIAPLLDILGLKREDTFAFGDSSNDLEILQYCQIGIAMGNATEELKTIADYVTSDVTDDGIFKAFEHFGLI
jgi:Cof subfamily protein (haloacid dehalogenase superfamily)